MTWLLAKGLFGLPRWAFVLGGFLLALALAIGFAAYGINTMLANAKQAGRDEVQARWEAEKRGAAEESARLTAELTEALGGIDGKLQTVLEKVQKQGRIIKVQTIKEIESDPRYSSDDCSVTDGVRSQINAARGLSGNPASSGVSGSTVPTSGAVVRFEFGDAGTGGY